ncbi:MAG: hypothetical protein Fur0022_48500 [Anaerolineales bacterium]
MKDDKLIGIRLQQAIRRHPLMNLAMFKEVGSASVIANLIDATFWGDFFIQPVVVTISSKGKRLAVKIEPGEFMIENILNAEIPEMLGETNSLIDWIEDVGKVRGGDSKPSKFKAISPVVYCSRWLKWTFDTSRETIIQEYLDGFPKTSPLRQKRDKTRNPITLFEFELSEEVFKEITVPIEGIIRVLNEFHGDGAIPDGVNIYPKVTSPLDYVVILK